VFRGRTTIDHPPRLATLQDDLTKKRNVSISKWALIFLFDFWIFKSRAHEDPDCAAAGAAGACHLVGGIDGYFDCDGEYSISILNEMV